MPMELPVRIKKFVGTLKIPSRTTQQSTTSTVLQSQYFATCACECCYEIALSRIFIFSSRHRILSIFARRRRRVSDADANAHAVESHAPDAL